MRFYSKLKLFFPLFLLFLTSCIAVKDIGPYWENAVLDPSIKGSWNDNKSCTRFVIDGKNYRTIDGKDKIDESLYRTMNLGKHKFFIVKTKEVHFLYRYKVFSDVLALYMPASDKKKDFLRDYPNANISFSTDKYSSTVKIPRLDKKSASLLQKISDDETYWKIKNAYHRVKQCKSDNDNS